MELPNKPCQKTTNEFSQRVLLINVMICNWGTQNILHVFLGKSSRDVRAFTPQTPDTQCGVKT